MSLAAILSTAIASHQAGKLKEAEGLYRQILAAEPEHSDALHLMGLLASQVGQFETAEKLMRRAIAGNSRAPIYHNNLGTVMRQMENSGEEEACYRRALAIDPELTAARDNLKRLLQKQGRELDAGRVDVEADMKKQKLVQLQEYQKGVESMRHTRYMDFPAHVHMETLAKCNAACVFCPYPELDRQGEKMEDDLVAKVIGDLADIPRDLPFQLSPFKVNEPFLDVRLFDILGSINQKLPHASITLTSNSTPITEKALNQLRKVNNLGYLWISFNDHREAEYEATMKLPYKRTIERLDMIHRKKAEGLLPFKVVLSRVGDNSAVDAEFCQWIRTHYPLFTYSIFQRGAWIGQVKDVIQEVPNVGCVRWFDLSITATGTVAHCCMDGQAKYPIGDVRTQHVLEIYNSPHYRQLREKTVTRMDASPCNACAFL